MVTKKRPSITAGELAAKLEADPEFVARRKAQEQKNLERAARIKAEQEPILTELRVIGLNVETVWDLAKSPPLYSPAIPILLRHLGLPYSDVTREMIARILAVPEPLVRQAWPVLAELYRQAPMGQGIKAPGDTQEFMLSAKDGLACALTAAVTNETLPELIAFAKDRSLGGSRVLLLSALKKRRNKNPSVAQVIEELATDPDLEKEIASWRKKQPA